MPRKKRIRYECLVNIEHMNDYNREMIRVIGGYLKYERLRRGLTLDGLADLCGCFKNGLSGLINGRCNRMSISWMSAIGVGLGYKDGLSFFRAALAHYDGKLELESKKESEEARMLRIMLGGEDVK